MVGIPYDDLNAWRGPYPADVFVRQLQKVAAGFERGCATLASAAKRAPPDRTAEAWAEQRLAVAAMIHFSSVADQAQFVQMRDALANPNLPEAKREELRILLRDLITREAGRARQLYRLQRQDSRIGFEASNHYYYLPQDLEEKFLNCQGLLRNVGK